MLASSHSTNRNQAPNQGVYTNARVEYSATTPFAAQDIADDVDPEGAIIQVVPHLESGPIGRFSADLALTVKRLGGDSRMVSSGGRFAQEVIRGGVVHEAMSIAENGALGLGLGGAAAKMASLFSRWQGRLVHSHGGLATARTRKAIGRGPMSHVASLYRLPATEQGKDAQTRALMSADRIIVASEFLRKTLATGYGDMAAKIDVIPPGLAINAVHPSVVTAARLTRLVKKIDFPTDAPLILFPAAIQPNAGHLALLDVLTQLSDSRWTCIFATIGPSHKKERQKLEVRVDQLGLRHRIRFVGNCDDPATLYKLSAVVVSSFVGNLAFDYAAAEAQAAGKLVLVPNRGASPYQVKAGEDGAIFEAGDGETLALALNWALSLPAEVRASIEHAATTRAYKTYKKDEAVKRVFDVYDSLLVNRS